MDLGIEGRRALVCGASEGLGYASALALAREGVDVVLAARTPAKLDAAADAVEETTVVRTERSVRERTTGTLL